MPHCKNTNILSEIETFFQNNPDNAILAMLTALKAIKITDKRMGFETHRNSTVSSSQKLQNLLIMPFVGCDDISKIGSSALSGAVGYNALYRIMRSDNIDWRKAHEKLVGYLSKYLEENTEAVDASEVCLVVDDTDMAKSGWKIENIGKIYSHTEHRHILGFKGLLLGKTDGKTFLPLDFSIHGEKGKSGSQGLKARQRNARKTTEPADNSPAYTRHSEYFESKIDIMIAMVTRAYRKGHDFGYLLIDSWFMCDKVVKAIRGLGGSHHVLGMLKNNVNKFPVGDEMLTTGQIVSKFKGDMKRCRKYHCHYIEVDTEMNGTPVRLFLCRRTKQDGWKTILTTDCTIKFNNAYKIYAKRWTIEVCFKECKQYLRLEGNQAQYFNAQVASTTVCFMQYAILSVVKRMTSYETLGGLFRGTKADVVEFTLFERILLILQDVLERFSEHLGFPNKEMVQKFLSDKQVLEDIKKIYHLKISA